MLRLLYFMMTLIVLMFVDTSYSIIQPGLAGEVDGIENEVINTDKAIQNFTFYESVVTEIASYVRRNLVNPVDIHKYASSFVDITDDIGNPVSCCIEHNFYDTANRIVLQHNFRL